MTGEATSEPSLTLLLAVTGGFGALLLVACAVCLWDRYGRFWQVQWRRWVVAHREAHALWVRECARRDIEQWEGRR